MALPIIPDCFRVAFKWSNPGGAAGRAVNVLHFSAPGKTTAQVDAAIDANVTANMWRSGVTTTRVEELDITPLDGTSATVPFPKAAVAKWIPVGGADFAPQTCYLIKLTTALRGPANRGRIFLPYLAESEQAAGYISLVAQPLITTAWVNFANAMAAAGVALGVASYKNSLWHQAINVGCETAIATQRRRQHR